jgi:hypothetical protein
MSRAIILLLLTAFSCIFAGHKDVPTFSICYPHYEYSQQVNGLLGIDFQNFPLIIFDDIGHEYLVTKLRNGLFNPNYRDWVKLASVEHFDFANHEPRKALVIAHWVAAGASASDIGVLQVLEVAKGDPVVLQQIQYNERGAVDRAGSSFDTKTGALTVRGVHGREHCCPDTMDVGTFQWNGSRFVLLKSVSMPMAPTQ